MFADDLHGAVMRQRVGVVALGQRGERLSVADIGTVLSESDDEFLAVQLPDLAGQGEEFEGLLEGDRLDELALFERREAALLAFGP